jgi:hypothetical protein
MQSYLQTSRDAMRLSDMSNIETGLENFRMNSLRYPEVDNGVDITYS